MIYQTNLGMVDVTTEVIDYIDSDSATVMDSPIKSIMITEESDLATLTEYNVGTIAFTAGFTKMYQLDADGDWINIDTGIAVDFDDGNDVVSEGGE